jgi:hypothetical protein
MLTLSDAANILPSLCHFLISWKDIPDNVLESYNIDQDFTEKFLLKQTVQKEIADFFKK